MPRPRRIVPPSPLLPLPRPNFDFEIPVIDYPTYTPGRTAPPTQPISLVPPRDSCGAYIVDKVITPFDDDGSIWGDQPATAEDYDTEEEDAKYEREPRRRTAKRVLNYVVGWRGEPFARQLVPCTQILDYVSPRTLEDWEYAFTERHQQRAETLAAKIRRGRIKIKTGGVKTAKKEEETSTAVGVESKPALSPHKANGEEPYLQLPPLREPVTPQRVREKKDEEDGEKIAATAVTTAIKATEAMATTEGTKPTEALEATESTKATEATEMTEMTATPIVSAATKHQSSSPIAAAPASVRFAVTPTNPKPADADPFGVFGSSTSRSSRSFMSPPLPPGRVTSLSTPPTQQVQLGTPLRKLATPCFKTPPAQSFAKISTPVTVPSLKRPFEDTIQKQRQAESSEDEVADHMELDNADDEDGDSWIDNAVDPDEEASDEHDGTYEGEEDDEEDGDEDELQRIPAARSQLPHTTYIPPPVLPARTSSSLHSASPSSNPKPKVTPIQAPEIPGMLELLKARDEQRPEKVRDSEKAKTVTPIPPPPLVYPPPPRDSGPSQEERAQSPEAEEAAVDLVGPADLGDASDEEDLYEVDQLEADHMVFVEGEDTAATGRTDGQRSGKYVRFFLVRWKGDWPPDENPTWEPAENLPPSMVDQYLKTAASQEHQDVVVVVPKPSASYI